jgi:hypothetical protein
VPENAFDELTLMRRSAFDTNGERKTVINGSFLKRSFCPMR